MKTINEIRRENLTFLVEQYGSFAKFNVALGRNRRDATLSQIRNGVANTSSGKPREMGDRLARSIEQKLNLGVGWMDTEHNFSEEDVDQLGEDVMFIPIFENKVSAGPGQEVLDRDIVAGGITFYKPFLATASRLRDFGNLGLFCVIGDSMSPTFEHGSILLVNRSIVEFQGSGIYIIRAVDELYVKRISRKITTGETIISSDNPSAGVPELLNGETQIEILGKVVFGWNGRAF